MAPHRQRSRARVEGSTIGSAVLGEQARELVTSGAYGHLVTLDPGGRPHVTLAWFDLDDDALVFGTLFNQRKLDNLRRDPRTVVSFESARVDERGLRPYLVVHGVATVTEGGAPALLQHLAHRYLGPDVTFPPMPDPPAGYVTRIAIESVGGVGPWAH
jgi:PPOX class probable F420-dependent enzyme